MEHAFQIGWLLLNSKGSIFKAGILHFSCGLDKHLQKWTEISNSYIMSNIWLRFFLILIISYFKTIISMKDSNVQTFTPL